MRKSLTDRGVSALKPRASRYAFPDPELSGHYVRVTPNGAKSFAAVCRSPDGKQIWTTIGSVDRMSIETARDLARTALQRVRAGLPAVEPRGETVATVAANWRKRHVERNGLRTWREIVRLLDAHILPAWGDREFAAIRRSDVAALLDEVEDNHGQRTADCVLTIVRSVMNWQATRDDDYSPPVVRGMQRQSTHAQARARILADDEIGAIWKAAEAGGLFGAFVRIALLTAQRREKVRTMRWADISDAGEWTIPQAPREKQAGGVLMLPAMALRIVRVLPQIGDNPFVFAGRGDQPFNTGTKAKRGFDAKLPKGTPRWTIHDLRRTARSLMSRAGVRPDIAERVLGHAIVGVEGTYDRHSYGDEKADALKRLATLIDGIVHPRANVVTMTKRAKRR
jgi:integrase